MANQPKTEEELDEEINNPPADPEPTNPGEGGDEPTDPPTAPQNPQDPNPDDEDDDDEDDGVEVDENSDDPKDIAIRNLRNKSKRQKRTINKLREATTTPQPSTPVPPTSRPNRNSPLWPRFVENEFRTSVLYAKETDPTVIQRLPLIKKIMFEEMPELLERGPQGFDIANDLSKGRTIKIASPTVPSAPVQPQTTPARPRGASTPVKPLSNEEYNKLPKAEQIAYENSLIEKAEGK